MDLLEMWRLGNAVVATLTLVYLMLDLRVVRYDLDSRRLYLTFALAGLLTAVVAGSINNVVRENAISPATPIISASVLWCLIGLWISRKDRSSIWKDFPK